MSDEKKQSPEEQGFNDSELQDIMQEIESLEKEFGGDSPDVVAESPAVEPEGDDKQDDRTDLQKAIDKEVEDLEMETNTNEAKKSVDEPENKHSDDEEDVFDESDFNEETHAKVTPISNHSHREEMQLKASGPMSLELNFPVGEQNANFKVLPQGFEVELNGIVVHVDDKKGCHISMPGGAEFSLPLEHNKVKKAS
jgi:hypothetical protein